MSTNNEAVSDQYYLQDSRSYVGNDVVWWAKDGKGYTTDLRLAHIYTKEQAVAHHESRSSDIPWPKEYIDNKTRPAVDMQYIKINEALAGTGIALITPKKLKPNSVSCRDCGKFIRAIDQFGDCPHCGADNRP
jgi:hypothetical protein